MLNRRGTIVRIVLVGILGTSTSDDASSASPPARNSVVFLFFVFEYREIKCQVGLMINSQKPRKSSRHSTANMQK